MNTHISKTKQHYFRRQPQRQTFQYKEFTHLNHAECMLPGKFKTIEVETCAAYCRTSFAMATPLHKNGVNYDYVDFWGNVNPYGQGCHLVFVCIVENDPGYNAPYRFVVTTGRHTHSGMSTNKFQYLEDAMKFAVREMEKTQLKFDKILGEKTQMWDMDAIHAYNNSLGYKTHE
jgi:hypothetical protein